MLTEKSTLRSTQSRVWSDQKREIVDSDFGRDVRVGRSKQAIKKRGLPPDAQAEGPCFLLAIILQQVKRIL